MIITDNNFCIYRSELKMICCRCQSCQVHHCHLAKLDFLHLIMKECHDNAMSQMRTRALRKRVWLAQGPTASNLLSWLSNPHLSWLQSPRLPPVCQGVWVANKKGKVRNKSCYASGSFWERNLLWEVHYFCHEPWNQKLSIISTNTHLNNHPGAWKSQCTFP